MFFRQKKIIGLDIGTSSIKVAEISASRNGVNLDSFAVVLTPENSIAGGEILDTIKLSEAVRSLLNQIDIKKKKVVTGIWGTAVIIKKISLPRMDENLVAEQIKW